jgi:hypothetical protein
MFLEVSSVRARSDHPRSPALSGVVTPALSVAAVLLPATKRCSRGRGDAAQPSGLLPRSEQRRLVGRTQFTTTEQGESMAETYSGEFYCVKCKEKREASGEVHVNDKGTRMAKAKCPVCGTNLNRILGKA